MKAQYSIAGMTKGVVVGTDHAAEAITGFFTKYGDGGTDINPLFRLNKRQGKQLLAHLGCPEHLYKKLPTADTEDDRPSLPDEVAPVSPTRTSTIIWKAKRWTRASPKRSRAGI